MKILYVTNNLKGQDGWSRYSLDLINEVQKHGHRALCLVYERSNRHQIKEKAILGPPSRCMTYPVFSFFEAYKVKKIIKEFSPDLIHFLAEPYAAALPFIKKKQKIVLTVHGTYSFMPNLLNSYFKKKISGWLSKKIFKKADVVISVSKFTKKYLIKEFASLDKSFNLADKIKVINNGINLEVFKIIDLTEKKPENKVKKILFVGSVKKGKGLVHAIEALSQYSERYSENFIYRIVGSCDPASDYYKKLIKKIQQYNLENKVKFLGNIDDDQLNSLYKASDLFLMLSINDGSDFEGFGLVFLEANAKGVPCLGPNDSGCQEAILDGITGYAVNPRDAKKAAEKIDLILNKKTIKMKDCINWARQNSIKEKYNELIQVYR